MNNEVHPYIQLRRKIRQTGKQFRKSNDNSTSLFHPNGGFIYAYEINKVEDALDEYEVTLPTEYLSVDNRTVMESKILSQAQVLVEVSEDMDVRDFARQVMAYMVLHEGQSVETKVPSLFIMKTDASVEEERDMLEG